jgi:hypothetical protein
MSARTAIAAIPPFAFGLRYLGTARNNAWLKNRTAALNLRNLLSRGLARATGAWLLA